MRSFLTPYILNLLDLLLTLHALQHGGVELNPLLQSLPVMVAWKVVGCGVLCYVLHHFARSGELVARAGLRICTAVYAAVCIYHFYFVFGGAFLWQSILPGMLS